jgi:DNA-binding Lrp family transcriptional regulator
VAGAPERESAAGREGWTPGKRVLELEREGRVEGYAPTLDYDALGMQTVVVRLRVLGDLEAVLADHGERVTDAYETTGAHDALLIARFADLGEMNDFLAELATDERVAAATANVVLRTACEYEFTRLLE